jgi:hypothetical protein
MNLSRNNIFESIFCSSSLQADSAAAATNSATPMDDKIHQARQRLAGMTAAAGAMSRCRRDASNQVSFDFGRNIAALKRQADDLLLLQAVTELTSMERESMALESCRLSLAAAAPEIAMPCSAAKADQLAPPDQTIVATTLRAAIQGNSHTHLSYGFDQWIAAVKTRDDPMSKAMLYLANREIARGWSIVEVPVAR